MTLVSTIIPAYNAEAFIREAIERALAQTHTDLEVIVVDDGSTDDTCRIVEEFDGRVTLLRQSNAGPAAARNRGAKEARGEWLAFLDADDLWQPQKLEKQLERADESKTPLSYTNRENIGACDHVARYQSDGMNLAEGDVFDALLQGNFITLSSVMIRRSLFQELGGFNEDPSLKAVEDWELWLRVTASQPVAFCPEPLVQYRFHPSGISRNVKTMESNLFNALRIAMASDRGRKLDKATVRRAYAAAWSVLGWSASANNPRSATRYFFRSWLTNPWNCTALKKVVKSCLGRA